MEKSKAEHIDELSKRLFNKPAKDIKYLMVTDFVHKSLLEENLNRTGLYNWIQTFKGKISKPGDVVDYNEFDIVHVNMSKQDRHLPASIRKKLTKHADVAQNKSAYTTTIKSEDDKIPINNLRLNTNSKTMIVCNNDYTSELWEGNYEHPDVQKKYYEDADVLFGTEYFQCVGLSEITGGKVYNIPHPANVTRLKTISNQKKPYIAVVWRRYDKFSYVPFLSCRDLGLQTVLVGYDRQQDPHWHITESMYDHVVYHTDYDKYCKILSEAMIVYNPYTLHSYDRLAVDVAALGAVCAGSDRTWAMKQCYPKTICDTYDVRQTKEILKKLCTDKEFYDKVGSFAQHKVLYFNQENAKLRMLNSLLDSKEGTQVKGVIEYADGFGGEDKPQPKVHNITDYITTNEPEQKDVEVIKDE